MRFTLLFFVNAAATEEYYLAIAHRSRWATFFNQPAMKSTEAMSSQLFHSQYGGAYEVRCESCDLVFARNDYGRNWAPCIPQFDIKGVCIMSSRVVEDVFCARLTFVNVNWAAFRPVVLWYVGLAASDAFVRVRVLCYVLNAWRQKDATCIAWCAKVNAVLITVNIWNAIQWPLYKNL